MGFGNWLKGATRVRFDSHTLGNLARNGGLAAGALIGGPAGAALAGGVSAARTAARPGANFGSILKSGLTDAGTATALNKAGGFLKGALSSPGAAAPLDTLASPLPPNSASLTSPVMNDAARHAGIGMPQPSTVGAPGRTIARSLSSVNGATPTATSAITGGSVNPALSAVTSGAGAPAAIGNAAMPSISQLGSGGMRAISAGAGAPAAIGNLATTGRSGLLGGVGRGLSSVGNFVGDHPDAIGMGLKGIGSIATSGSENRMNEAEIRALDQRTNLSAEEAERKRQQDVNMEPIRQALMLQLAKSMGGAQTPIAANPYALPLAGG